MVRRNRTSSQPRRGFTKTDLLALIVVGIAMASVGSLALAQFRVGTSRIKCINNLKAIGLAIHNYEGIYQGITPATLACATPTGIKGSIDDGITWATLLLPYLEAGRIYDKLNLSSVGYFPNGDTQFRDVANSDEACLQYFLCPLRRVGLQKCPQGLKTEGDGGACGDYAAVACNPTDNSKWYEVTAPVPKTGGALIAADRYGSPANPNPNGLSFRSRTSFASITDGLSNTFALGEKHLTSKGLGNVREGDGCVYYFHATNPRKIEDGKISTNAASYSLRAIRWNPQANDQDSLAQKGSASPPNDTQFGGNHAGVVPFLIVDGSVKTINVAADKLTLACLANRCDGRFVSVDDVTKPDYSPDPVGPDAPNLNLRIWTSASRQRKIEAEITNITVTLRRKDGREVTIPISDLSPEDQQYILQNFKK